MDRIVPCGTSQARLHTHTQRIRIIESESDGISRAIWSNLCAVQELHNYLPHSPQPPNPSMTSLQEPWKMPLVSAQIYHFQIQSGID